MQNDSVEKIVQRYFATVTIRPFVFKGLRYKPKVLKVSPLLLRDYTCPPMCGGCCFKFSLDYLPSETRPWAKKRLVEFDGRQIEIWTDWQEKNEGSRCQYLLPKDGRCGVYETRPFTCDFELIRTLQGVSEGNVENRLTQKLFGRGWSYPRVDGGKGALCEMTPVSEKSVAEVVRKLERLKAWTDHFGLEHTWIPTILNIIRRNHLTHQIILSPFAEHLGFGL